MVKDYVYYLFDFDLTLADSSRGIVMCFTHVLERHGYHDVTEMQIKRTIGKTLEESFSILTGIKDPQQLAAWKLEYTHEADIYMNDNTVLFPETVSVLTKLKEQGAKLAIISTKYRYRIQGVMDRYFPKDFIDVIIGGEDVKVAKPDPRGVKAALKRLKAKKKYALYVGDSTVDAETAKNAGVDFCGVLNGLTTFEELAAYPHHQILNNLTLLPLLQKDVVAKPKRFNIIPAEWIVKHRAFKIKQIRGINDVPLEKPEGHVCLNCGDVYEGDFCRSCGQPAKTSRITLKNSFSNFFSSFFSIESGFLRTCYELWYRPGYMVMDFIRGKRQSYYKPFSLLIVMAALFIVAVHLLDPSSVTSKTDAEEKTVWERVSEALNNEQNDSTLTIDDIIGPKEEVDRDSKHYKSGYENGKIISTWVFQHTGPGSYFYAVMDLLKEWFEGNQAFLFITTIPLYIYGARRGFRHSRVNNRLNIGEYTFIFGYFGSQLIMRDMLLIPFYGSAIANVTFGSGLTISSFIEFLIMLRNFKQLYQLDWKATIMGTIKTYIYMMISLLMVIIVGAILLGLIVLGIIGIVEIFR